MLAAHSSVQGSTGYVAMERMSGSRAHWDVTLGEPQLPVTVVPDSGAGAAHSL